MASNTTQVTPPSIPVPASLAVSYSSNHECKHGILSKYGIQLSPPLTVFSGARHIAVNVTTTFGCSTHAKYCNGEIQSIPCCTKIAYDMWYEFDRYLTAYNVTYTLTLGSLLMAVRDGRHAPWDSKDIDLGFLSPPHGVKEAVNEFMRAHNLSMEGVHHIRDWKQNFIQYHHQKHGYPAQLEERNYCFYDKIGISDFSDHTKSTSQLKELLRNEDALVLGGTNPFLDYFTGYMQGCHLGGSDTQTRKRSVDDSDAMVEVEYKGSNGISPPRKMYVFPDYYKMLYSEYGDDWHQGYTFLDDTQLTYYGLPAFNNSYFRRIYHRTGQKLSQIEKYNIKYQSNRTKRYFKKFTRLFIT